MSDMIVLNEPSGFIFNLFIDKRVCVVASSVCLIMIF